MEKLIDKEKGLLNIISEIFVFILIIIYPLMVDSTGYYHILEYKWYSYMIISSIYLFLMSVVIIYFLFFKKINIFRYVKLNIIHYLSLLYLFINVISCFMSPFFKDYNLFVGVGRGEGLITKSLYVLTFILVSLFLKFKKRHLLYFSITSILLNTVAIIQYIGYNPFYLYKYGIGTHNTSFMTTIGNVDFISSLYTMLLPISFCSYIFLDNLNNKEKIIHLLSLFLGYFIFSIIDVKSGKVAFISALILIFPFIISNNKRLSKLILCYSLIIMTYCINIFINPEYHYSIGKIVFNFQFNYIVIILLLISILLIYISIKIKNIYYDISHNKKIIKSFYLFLILLVILFLTTIYFYDFGKIKWGLFYEIKALLHGDINDRYATYRMFLWKRTLKIFLDYPMIGSGPDTFIIRFMAKYTNDIIGLGSYSLNDTAGNNYLTMLINIGILGLASYISFIYFQIKKGIRCMNDYSKILLISIICFIIQDFFNLWLVIVTPIFWILMAIHYSAINKNKVVEKNKKV